jgi:hypothetical protein
MTSNDEGIYRWGRTFEFFEEFFPIFFRAITTKITNFLIQMIKFEFKQITSSLTDEEKALPALHLTSQLVPTVLFHY